MNSLRDKVVLITGGGAGIGRATALQFAARDARVVVTGRHSKPLEALAAAHSNILFKLPTLQASRMLH